MALTRRQREIYDFVREFIEARGYSPSLEEIGEQLRPLLGRDRPQARPAPRREGLAAEGWNRSRSVEPVERESASAIELPLLGVVAAGAPIESGPVEERISVPREMVGRSRETFVLRVRGDSMIDEHIQDGDHVVVERRHEARNGETVVARVRGDGDHAEEVLPPRREGRPRARQPGAAADRAAGRRGRDRGRRARPAADLLGRRSRATLGHRHERPHREARDGHPRRDRRGPRARRPAAHAAARGEGLPLPHQGLRRGPRRSS